MSALAVATTGFVAPATTSAAVQPIASRPVPTILGRKLRRLIVGTINGLAPNGIVKVEFKGTRAYTNGRTITLPKIRDLAQIPWDRARALIGYAIHELGHILYTDFTQVERAFAEGKLVKSFENCIEDYRIERRLVAEFPGAREDLTALRVRIHPRLNRLTTGWLRDPRACGPLALTWTGSRLNGFPNPHLQQTIDAIPAPVMALVERWTVAMTGVPDTAAAVDLAIAFKAEAEAYAERTRSTEPDAAPDDRDEDSDADGDPSRPRSGGTGGADVDPAQSEDDDDRSNDRPIDDDAPAPDADPDDDGFDDDLDEDLDPSARMDDFLDDIAEAIADAVREGGALPEEAPEPTDGEVDPSDIVDDIAEANAPAPDYVSPDEPPADRQPGASKHHWDDSRFVDVEVDPDACRYGDLMTAAGGVVSTTARTVRRLLMAEGTGGVVLNRRSGDFDIRNMSAIVRNTGTCYRRTWSRPAPSTLLVVLMDFSGSMRSRFGAPEGSPSPQAVAMTGAVAIEQATHGTQVRTAIYSYTGTSPQVQLAVFKEGPESTVEVSRRIGAYGGVAMDMTPTAEAMAAVASRIDDATEDRRILLVLTDGRADDMDLCTEVCGVLASRGIEVVAIGIGNDSVSSWAPTSHVISDVGELPAALLATIDPRGAADARRGRAQRRRS